MSIQQQFHLTPNMLAISSSNMRSKSSGTRIWPLRNPNRFGFALASTGFGLTRPGFTAGASLAVPQAEQGGVAGVITAANGISFVAAPAIGMALYALDPHLPFAASAVLLVLLAMTGRRQLQIT